jgi:hypothetical protein
MGKLLILILGGEGVATPLRSESEKSFSPSPSESAAVAEFEGIGGSCPSPLRVRWGFWPDFKTFILFFPAPLKLGNSRGL